MFAAAMVALHNAKKNAPAEATNRAARLQLLQRTRARQTVSIQAHHRMKRTVRLASPPQPQQQFKGQQGRGVHFKENMQVQEYTPSNLTATIRPY